MLLSHHVDKLWYAFWYYLKYYLFVVLCFNFVFFVIRCIRLVISITMECRCWCFACIATAAASVKDCLESYGGYAYRGFHDKTEFGRQCMEWTADKVYVCIRETVTRLPGLATVRYITPFNALLLCRSSLMYEKTNNIFITRGTYSWIACMWTFLS